MTEKIKELLRDRQKLKDSYVDAITKMDKLNWINNDIANVLETHLQGFEEVLAVPEGVSRNTFRISCSCSCCTVLGQMYDSTRTADD